MVIRIVPPEEADFRERCKRAVWQFIMDEGLNFRIAERFCERTIENLGYELWYVRKWVVPEDTDTMNSREERKKWEAELNEKEAEGLQPDGKG